MEKTILIVEDETNIVDILSFNLEREGYNTIEAYDGQTGLQLAREQNPDLILLDLMLPGLSGEEVLHQIQGVPVIVVSAKVDVQDKVKLLLDGASDYITKPFDTAELLARITVQLRKSNIVASEVIAVGDLRLDLTSHQVTVEGIELRLTRTEYAIAKLLMQNAGKVIAKSVMLDKINHDTPDCTESSLKQHISNLRKKLRDSSGKDYIESVWGIGFMLSEKS